MKVIGVLFVTVLSILLRIPDGQRPLLSTPAVGINPAATLNLDIYLFGFVDAAGLMNFKESLQIEIRGLENVNIDNLRPYIGNYIYWGGTLPIGTFPITVTSNVSLILLIRSVSGMSIQTIYTGVVSMGVLNHKYERVFTDKWGSWTDMGSINPPH